MKIRESWLLVIFFSILYFVPCFCFAQSKDTISAEKLREVRITKDKSKMQRDVNVGTRVSSIDNIVLKQNIMSSLGDLLSENSTIYIKSLGQGAMSTSSFRGTSSAHTQVLWNGVRINPAMSTSFDFSQLPVLFMDNVSLFHGNSGVKGGSGALGGTVSIENSPDYSKVNEGNIFFEYGSCETYTGALSFKTKLNNLVSKTRLFIQGSENDFKYLNKVYSKDPFYERRKESEYSQIGVMQELYHRLGSSSMLSANIWYQYGDRELPQPVIVNVTQHENQRENNLRALLSYRYSKDIHLYNIKVAYLYSSLYWKKWFEGYPDNVVNTNNYSRSFQAISDYSFIPSTLLRCNVQLTYIRDWVDATSYSLKRVSRDVLSLQSNVLYNFNPRMSAQLQGMVEYNKSTNNLSKLLPTFSAALLYSLSEDLKLKANISYNYKFPSMNDLYWQPGGNEYLKPEKGFSYDLGMSYRRVVTDNLSVSSDVTGYYMNISDWIMWLPNSGTWFWSPKNLNKVNSYGIEASMGSEYNVGDYKFNIKANYTFSRAYNSEERFAGDASVKSQLPYIPKHKLNVRFQGGWRDLYLSYGINYVGRRYTTEDESYFTNSYHIHNISLWYDKKFMGRLYIMPKITINNLFNAYYESTQYYPMPVRMFYCSVVIGF